MARSADSAARRLDFGDLPSEATIVRGFRSGLQLATGRNRMHGADKYRLLELRRRRAQIRARHALGV